MSMKRIQIKYFASVREALQCEAEPVSTRANTLAELRQELRNRNSVYNEALDAAKAVRAALNHVLVHDEEVPLADGAEVAFFPPVTGG
jgi:molybdopterin synthase sulfur carrier subunit